MRLLSCSILLLFLCAGIAAQENPRPELPTRLRDYVTDETGTLSRQDLTSLNAKLREFDRATSTQIVVVVISTIGAEPLEEASLRIATANGIGRDSKDNGVLLLVVKNDRRVRIEVGYGLEGVLTDVLSGLIIRQEIVPRFREGDYGGGIDAGVTAIMKATRNEYSAEPEKESSPRNLLPLLVTFFVIFFIISRSMRGGGKGRFPGSRWGGGIPPIGGGWGGMGGGGFGGGGFGGGGFSGGGGSFGGGGASGRW